MNLTLAALAAMAISFVTCALVAWWHVIPFARRQPSLREALTPLLWLHAPRHVALLIFSVQAQGLPITDATRDQIVGGDLLGAALALATLGALRAAPRLVPALGWAFVVATLVDIANAAYRGLDERLFDHVSGWPWVILTFYVPVLTLSALLVGWQLWVRTHVAVLAVR